MHLSTLFNGTKIMTGSDEEIDPARKMVEFMQKLLLLMIVLLIIGGSVGFLYTVLAPCSWYRFGSARSVPLRCYEHFGLSTVPMWVGAEDGIKGR